MGTKKPKKYKAKESRAHLTLYSLPAPKKAKKIKPIQPIKSPKKEIKFYKAKARLIEKACFIEFNFLSKHFYFLN